MSETATQAEGQPVPEQIRESVKAPGVYAKFSKTMGEIGSVDKNGVMTINNKDIAYVTHDEIMNAATRAMVANGLAISDMRVSDYRNDRIYETELQNGYIKRTFFVDLMLEFDIVDTDTGEKIHVGPIPGCASDSNDKSAYKALSNAKKYAFMLAFGIACGLDVESDQPEERNEQHNGDQQRRQPAPRQTAPPARAAKPLTPEEQKRFNELKKLGDKVVANLKGRKGLFKQAMPLILGTPDYKTADHQKVVQILTDLAAMSSEEAIRLCNRYVNPEETETAPEPPPATAPEPTSNGNNQLFWSLAPMMKASHIGTKAKLPDGQVVRYFQHSQKLTRDGLPTGHAALNEEMDLMYTLTAEEIVGIIAAAETQSAA